MAAKAGTSPSAINYNFGGLERLLSQAFERGAARTAAWLDDRRGLLADLPARPASAVFAVELLVRDWTGPMRPLALLYQEQRAAGHGMAGWLCLWRDFWTEVAAGFGLSEVDGGLLQILFESTSLG